MSAAWSFVWSLVAVWGPALGISLGVMAAARAVRPASPAWPPAPKRRIAGRSWRPSLERGRGRYRAGGQP